MRLGALLGPIKDASVTAAFRTPRFCRASTYPVNLPMSPVTVSLYSLGKLELNIDTTKRAGYRESITCWFKKEIQ